MPLHAFLFSATSGTLLFAGVKRLLLAVISGFLKKTPDSIDTDRKMQCLNNFQTGDVRMLIQKFKNMLLVGI